MTIQIIPISAVPSQSFTIKLGNQNCAIKIYQLQTGLYFDLSVDGNVIITSMICLNLVGLVREKYLGFIGQFVFFDTKGTADPNYDELGSRYQLFYQS